jgi:hypothetical protein
MSGGKKVKLVGYKKELERLLVTHLDGTYKHEGNICNCPIGEWLGKLIGIVNSSLELKD